MMTILQEREATECSCAKCQQMCLRPCWPSPEEVEKLIDAKLGSYLMLDHWVRSEDDGGNIYLICPANKGREGGVADFFFPHGECTFFQRGLCMLHDRKLKPIEGRLADCKNPSQGALHKAVADLWDTKKGAEVVHRWKMECER